MDKGAPTVPCIIEHMAWTGGASAMTTEEMRYFIAAYESGSFSMAAKKLCISAQGLGRSISNLERRMGVELFFRTFTGIKPTAVAERIYQDFKAIVQREDELLAYVEDYKAGHRSRFIGQDSEIGNAIAAGFEDYSRQCHEDVIVELTRRPDHEIASLISSGSIDYRFTNKEIDTVPWLQNAVLGTTEYAILLNASDSLLARQEISFLDLQDKTVLSESVSYTLVKMVEHYFREAGLVPSFRIVNFDYILKLIAQSPQYVYFTRRDIAEDFARLSDQVVVARLSPPMLSTLILQTSHDKIPPQLLECIGARMRSCGFVQPPLGS